MALTDAGVGAVIHETGERVHVTLAGTCLKGDLLGYSSGWKRALAAAGSVVVARLVALEDGVSGEIIQAATSAVVSGRYSGAAPGAVMYLAEGADNGEVTDVLPTTQNDATTVIGFAIEADKLYLSANLAPDTVDPS